VIDKPATPDSVGVLLDIDQLMRSNRHDEAKKQLLNLDLSDDFVRKFLIGCILQTEDFELALKIFTVPKTDEELIVASNAAIQLNNKNKMKELLMVAKNFSSTNPGVKEVTKKIEVLLK
jgi:hypothetical protein